jgi:hypothetical protein
MPLNHRTMELPLALANGQENDKQSGFSQKLIIFD